jgi:hypothetical protein
LPRPTLVAVGAKWGAHDIDLMVGLSGDQEFGIDIAAVEQVHAGEEVALRQVLVDGGAHDAIRCGRRCGDHLGDEMGLVIITGFGEVDLIADPLQVTFRTVPGVSIVR